MLRPVGVVVACWVFGSPDAEHFLHCCSYCSLQVGYSVELSDCGDGLKNVSGVSSHFDVYIAAKGQMKWKMRFWFCRVAVKFTMTTPRIRVFSVHFQENKTATITNNERQHRLQKNSFQNSSASNYTLAARLTTGTVLTDFRVTEAGVRSIFSTQSNVRQ